MQTIKNLPLYWAVVDDADMGLKCISLVDRPAIERGFLALHAGARPVLCAVADEEKRRVYGVILRANFPIYRKDRERGEYYIAFSPETIRATVEKFFADGRAGEVNRMHAPGSEVEGVNLVQMFIKDTAAGISPAGFEDIEDGSLFGEYHVVNPEIWAAVKAGTYRGFSIEGIFNFHTSPTTLNPQTAMSKLEKFKSGLAKLLVALGAATTDKGAIFWDGDEDLKAGDAVFIEDENGERKAAPDGDYKTDDGKTIKVADGKVAEIVDPEAEVAGAAAGNGAEGDEGGEQAPANGNEGADKEVETLRKDLEETRTRLDEVEQALEKILAALDAANVKLQAIEKTPAAAPAHKEFSTGAPVGNTGNAGMDRLARMLGNK